MIRLRTAVLPASLAAACVVALSGCGPSTATTASTPSSAPTTSISPGNPTTSDLRGACLAARAAISDTFERLFDHPGDLAAAAQIYARGAERLRTAVSGAPIEREASGLVTTMVSISKRLAAGHGDDGTSDIPRAGQPLTDACSAVITPSDTPTG